MVGAPASGKSTWAGDYAKQKSYAYISTDVIRAEIGKDEGDQEVSGPAWYIARKRVAEWLSIGKSVVIDATNVDSKTRKGWIKIAQEFSAETVAVVFEVDREELIKRDAGRKRSVGASVIDHFLEKYNRPDTTEVDKVIILSPK